MYDCVFDYEIFVEVLHHAWSGPPSVLEYKPLNCTGSNIKARSCRQISLTVNLAANQQQTQLALH